MDHHWTTLNMDNYNDDTLFNIYNKCNYKSIINLHMTCKKIREYIMTRMFTKYNSVQTFIVWYEKCKIVSSMIKILSGTNQEFMNFGDEFTYPSCKIVANNKLWIDHGKILSCVNLYDKHGIIIKNLHNCYHRHISDKLLIYHDPDEDRHNIEQFHSDKYQSMENIEILNLIRKYAIILVTNDYVLFEIKIENSIHYSTFDIYGNLIGSYSINGAYVCNYYDNVLIFRQMNLLIFLKLPNEIIFSYNICDVVRHEYFKYPHYIFHTDDSTDVKILNLVTKRVKLINIGEKIINLHMYHNILITICNNVSSTIFNFYDIDSFEFIDGVTIKSKYDDITIDISSEIFVINQCLDGAQKIKIFHMVDTK